MNPFNNNDNIRTKIIHFPSFEKHISGYPDYSKGKYIFLQKYRYELDHFPKGIWFASFPGAPSPDHRFKACIQILNSRVVQMSCTCHKYKDCEHAIAALFWVREKYIDSDDESDDDAEEIQENLIETRSYSFDSSGEDSFIDDRDESDLSVEDENALENDNPDQEEMAPLQHEFRCQICLEDLEIPVLFSCLSHSVCYDCAESLFENAPKDRDGSRKIKCPTCGEKHFFKIKAAEELKNRINKGLRRIIASYQQEKELIQKRENVFKEEINCYKSMLAAEGNKENSNPLLGQRRPSERSSTQDSLRKADENEISADNLLGNQPTTFSVRKVFKVQSRKAKEEKELEKFVPVHRETNEPQNCDLELKEEEGFKSKRTVRKLLLDEEESEIN